MQNYREHVTSTHWWHRTFPSKPATPVKVWAMHIPTRWSSHAHVRHTQVKTARKGGLKVCEARSKTSRAAYSQVRAWPPLVAISVLVLAPGTAALPQPYRIPRRYSSCDAARSPAADGGDCTRCVLAVYPTYILAVSGHRARCRHPNTS